jgi:hypothetical protein
LEDFPLDRVPAAMLIALFEGFKKHSAVSTLVLAACPYFSGILVIYQGILSLFLKHFRAAFPRPRFSFAFQFFTSKYHAPSHLIFEG